ncbi:FxsA family protein [Phaeobacter sp. C3_T13_0]|uniref:FxsA family protein n=1 Tax=Phaeobacter cretensis TaxID=3342641 RepID=UPI0039BC2223
MYLFLAFLMIPIIEIALFIQVGGAIGMWPTLAIVVLTAVLGTWLVRTQGRLALGQLRASFEQLNDPTEPLAHGAMILVAGALLLTPGFFTDAVGFSLLVPQVRMSVYRYLRSKMTVARFQMGPGSMHGRSYPGSTPTDNSGDVIDADYEDVSQNKPRKDPSGWVDGPS